VRIEAVPNCADCGGESQIATVRPDGTRLKVLTHTPGADPDTPDFSPDGRKLVFVVYPGYGEGAHPCRRGRRHEWRTVFAAGRRFSPYGTVFSPDGKKIAFEQNGDVWTIGAAGTNPTNVTDTPERLELDPD